MKSSIALTIFAGLLMAASAQAGEAWKGYNKGIMWENSLDAAQERAAREGKPILFHQLVGDMNKEGC